MGSFARLFLVSIVTGTLTFPAYSATPEQLKQAKSLFDSGKAQEAFILLEKSHSPDNANTQELFLLGISAKKSGQLQKAEQYFRSALSREPNSGRIRLELAEVLFKLGKLDEAQAELLTVQETKPPKQVQQNIDRFLAQTQIAKSPKPKNWNGYITAGMTYDSNANAGTDTDTIFLYGLPFTLSSDAKESEDTAWFIRMGGNYSIPINSTTTWQTGLHASFTDYFTADTFDNFSLNASSGLSFKLNQRAILSVPLTANLLSYTDSGENWYSSSFGIAPRFQYALQNNLQFGLGASISRKVYNNNDRDLTAWSVSPSLNYQPIKDGNIAFGVNFGGENSGLDIYSNTIKGVYVGYQHRFREQGIRAGVTLSYTDTEFDGIQAAYTVARHDKSKRLSAFMSYALPNIENAEISASASYQDNDSNLPINTYDRTQFSLSFTKRF